jgi:hypothetical protein
MLDLPTKKFLSTYELAKRWGVDEDLIRHYVEEYGLRHAFRRKDNKHYVLRYVRDEKTNVLERPASIILSKRVSIRKSINLDEYEDQWFYISSTEPESFIDRLLIGSSPQDPSVDSWPTNVIVESFDNQMLLATFEDHDEVLGIAYNQVDLVFTNEEIERFETELNKSPNPRIEGNWLRITALLIKELSLKTPRFLHNEKPNFQQIAERLSEHLAETGEKEPAQRTLRAKLSEAYKTLYPD